MINSDDFDVYLGDAVYLGNEGGTLVLYTTNGVDVTNQIFLEPQVYANLERHVTNLRNSQKPSS